MRLLAASVLATGLLSVALAAPAHAGDRGWAHPGYGSGNTFYQPHESAINAASIGDVESQWSVELPTIEEYSCTEPSAPLVAGGRVFVTDEAGIGAYRQTTGARLWHHDWDFPDDTYTPHLAVAGGLLIAGSTECQSQSDPNGAIVALNVTNGEQKWQVDVGGPVESLVVDKGIIAVAGSSESSDPAVAGYRLRDGKLRWTLGDHFSAGVAAGGKLLVEGTEEQGYAAVSITTGRKVWSRPSLLTGLAANPSGTHFYLADGDGGLVCVRSSDGAKLWSGNGTGGPIASDGRRVYRGFSNSIEALDARTGTRLWIRRLGAPAGQPVRAGGLLYTDGASLTILDPTSGAPIRHRPFGAATSHHVVVADGRLFRINGDNLTAYAP
jgi:outer membrane protein assembly factor BamB